MSEALTRSVSARLNMDVTGWVAGGTTAQKVMRDVAQQAERSARQAIAAQKRAAVEAEKAERQKSAAAQRSAAEAERAAAREAAAARKRTAEVAAAQQKLGTAVLGIGVVAGAAFGLAAKKSSDFEVAMSAVRASTQATDATLAGLRQTALDLGASTQFSAEEAAQGITAMAKAGVAASDIMGGGLKGALDLAAAGQLSVADSAEIAATAMTQFGLSGKDIPHVADLLAAGAGKAQGEVTDLASALKYVGPVAKGMGVSIEETTGAIAELSAQGVIGEQAGTSLRGVLLALTSPSQQAAETMRDLGINVYDAQGNFVGLQGVAGQLQSQLGKLTQAERDEALGRIFGNTQVTAARILYQGGAAAVKSWTEEVNDSGFAARQAAQLTDNLRGDIERLGGALDTALISGGSGSQGVLRSITQDVTSMVDSFNDAPPIVQNATTALVGLTAVVGITGGAALILVPKLAAAKTALDTLGVSARTSGLALRGTAGAFAVVGAAAGANVLADWAGRSRVVTVQAQQMAGALKELGSTGEFGKAGLQGLSKEFGPLHDRAGTTKEALDAFGVSAYNALDQGWDARLGRWQSLGARTGQFNKQIEQLDAGLAALVQQGNADEATAAFDRLTKAAVDQGVPLASVRAQFTQYQAALDAVKNAAPPVTEAVGAVGGQLVRAGDEAKAAADGLKAFMDGLDAIYTKSFGAEEAADAFTSSLKSLNKETKDNGDVTTGNTAKALANREALRARAKAALDSISALAQSGATTEQVTAASERYRKRLYDAAIAAGFGKEAAEKYSGALRKVPKNVATNLTLNGADTSITKAQKLRDALLAIRDRHVSVSVTVNTANKLQQPGLDPRVLPKDGGTVERGWLRRADGGTAEGFHGTVTGFGGPRQDNIPAMLSVGEEVIKNGPAQRFRPLLKAINRMADGGTAGGVRGYASGGTVADFSSILSLIPTGSPSRDDITDLTSRRARAVTALHAAEAALAKVRANKHHTARQIAIAEERVANARTSVSTATRKLHTAEAQRAAASKPFSSRFLTAATSANRSDATFIRNVNTLASRGFGDLARQLLEMGGPEAKSLAATAVKSTAAARKLSGALATNASNQARLDALPARLAISSALKSSKNPTLAGISASTGISTSELQAAALAMRSSLGANPNARALLSGLQTSSQYVGGFGQTGGGSGDQITVSVLSTGNPWLDGQKAMQGAKRELATTLGRW